MLVNKIIQGHVLDILRQTPDEFVDCVVTSPPYWRLRAYGTEPQIWDGDKNCNHEWQKIRVATPNQSGGHNGDKLQIEGKKNFQEQVDYYDRAIYSDYCVKCNAWKGELGQEPTMDEYIDHLIEIFIEIKRILKKTGTCWVNIGDVYGSASSFSNTSRQGFNYNRAAVHKKVIEKCLLMIPERFAIKMIENGWILRNKIIWHKPNAFPTSAKDRFKVTWEFLYFFVKSKRYYFDLDAIKESFKMSSIDRLKNNEQNRGISDEVNESEMQKLIFPKDKRYEVAVRLSPKYSVNSNGHSNRQGLNRELDIVTIKAYKEYQRPIAEFLKAHIKPEHKPILDQVFGKHRWTHWIRVDFSGAALPGIEDWFKLKEILKFDDRFDDKIYEVEKLNIPVFQSGTNPGDMWSIPTKPFSARYFISDTKVDHFAVFPEELVIRPIMAGCPENGIVMDPFAGSGTVCAVAKRYGRNYIGIELNPEYVRIAEKRVARTRFEKQEELFENEV